MARITIERNIKQDTDSRSYFATFYYGKDSAGRAKRKTRSFPTLDEARLALKQHELDYLRGDSVEPSRMTVNEAIAHHLEILLLKSEASTLYGYRGIAKHIVAHKLGGRVAQDIKPADIQRYLAWLQTEKKLSGNTALKHYNFLNSVFNLLEQQELISRNPVKRVVAPRKQKYEPEYLTADEALMILKRAKGDRMELPLALGLYTGMRRGELCGLTWDCVDFERETIQVRKSRVNVGSEIIVKQPKSESSERTLSMVPELKKLLLRELEKQGQNKAQLGREYIGDGYVLCFNNGEPIRPNYLSEIFKRWFARTENHDLHTVTPHELRHSFVALTIAAGVPLYEISQALGHNDIGITSRIYAHLLDKSHKNVTDSMARLLRDRGAE